MRKEKSASKREQRQVYLSVAERKQIQDRKAGLKEKDRAELIKRLTQRLFATTHIDAIDAIDAIEFIDNIDFIELTFENLQNQVYSEYEVRRVESERTDKGTISTEGEAHNVSHAEGNSEDEFVGKEKQNNCTETFNHG